MAALLEHQELNNGCEAAVHFVGSRAGAMCSWARFLWKRYLLLWGVDVFYGIFACSGGLRCAPLELGVLVEVIFQNGLSSIC